MLSMRCFRPDDFLFGESLNRNLCDRRIVERYSGNLPEESGSQLNREGMGSAFLSFGGIWHRRLINSPVSLNLSIAPYVNEQIVTAQHAERRS
jgi:hypothetical protein